MFFKKPKKEVEIAEKPIEKCSFCKKRVAIAKANGTNYCSKNVCAKGFWKKQK